MELGLDPIIKLLTTYLLCALQVQRLHYIRSVYCPSPYSEPEYVWEHRLIGFTIKDRNWDSSTYL